MMARDLSVGVVCGLGIVAFHYVMFGIKHAFFVVLHGYLTYFVLQCLGNQATYRLPLYD